MFLEILVFFGVLILAMFVFAEMTKKAGLGMIASVLIFILGLWLIFEPIQIQTGQITTITSQSNSSTDISNITKIDKTETANETNIYSDLPVIPHFPIAMPFNWILGFIFILLSIYGGLFYTMQLGQWKN